MTAKAVIHPCHKAWLYVVNMRQNQAKLGFYQENMQFLATRNNFLQFLSQRPKKASKIYQKCKHCDSVRRNFILMFRDNNLRQKRNKNLMRFSIFFFSWNLRSLSIKNVCDGPNQFPQVQKRKEKKIISKQAKQGFQGVNPKNSPSLIFCEAHSMLMSFFPYTECKYSGPLGRRPGRVMKVS